MVFKITPQLVVNWMIHGLIIVGAIAVIDSLLSVFFPFLDIKGADPLSVTNPLMAVSLFLLLLITGYISDILGRRRFV